MSIWTDMHQENAELKAERDQLRAEVETLRKNAERWKWLESADSADWEHIGDQAHMNRHLHVDVMRKGKYSGRS